MDRFSIYLCLACMALSACNTSRQAYLHPDESEWEKHPLPDSLKLEHVVFVAGGAAEGRNRAHTALPLLGSELAGAGEEGTVVFLGDNVNGVNLQSKRSRRRAESRLDEQLKILEGHEGMAVFMPGEKDWNHGRRDGREAVRWQEDYVQKRLDDGGDNFLPNNACGEPEKIKINDEVRLLFIDSQWWRQDWNSIRKMNNGCEVKDRFAFLQELEDDLKKYDKERVLLFAHHPLRSNGMHGGGFGLKHHIFPLTMWKPNIYLPLPGLGSLAVFARQLGVSPRDIQHPRHVRLRNEVEAIAAKKPNNRSLVFVGAHDRSLQYFAEGDGEIQYVVSGSAGHSDFARGGRGARFVHAEHGFAKFYFYENQEVWLEFVVPAAVGSEEGRTVFRKRIFEGVILPDQKPTVEEFEPLPDSVTVAASGKYEVGGFRKVTFGDRYREAWRTPVTAPVFDLGGEFKHLTPVKQGGGMSSKSLRLEDEKGRQWVLRSIDKDVSRGLPKEMRETVVHDFIQDLKSGAHPYGAFAVPPLAEAAGVYHTNPRLFYVPKQPGLGGYNENFGDALYLFEERPAGDCSHVETFGRSPKIENFLKALEKTKKDFRHQVDEKWALRSRLFDQLIHDYDRHDDQWRWASFPEGDMTLWRPVPRDRDQAFFDLRGVVPYILSREWMAVQQRGFRGKITDVPGEAYPGSVFDRTFITELNRADWLAVANEMKAAITDSVIETALRQLPPEVYDLNAPQIEKVLKERRDRLPQHAEELYEFYARYVDVTGTEKDDIFAIDRRPDGSLAISIFNEKNGEQGERYYHRVFLENETREVRLYGLGGEDKFEISGKGSAITVRLIGGDGDDEVQEMSNPDGRRKRTVVYDTPDGMTLEGEMKDQRSRELKVNEYDRQEFKYNRYFPLVNFGRTVDDGFFLGAGVRLTRYRFRKRPYGIQHNIFAQSSFNTQALQFSYVGDYVGAIGPLDFNPRLRFDRPIIVNFFGLGNNSLDTAANSQFNWVRLEKFTFQPLLKKRWYNGRNFTRFGPFVERVEVENKAGRITDSDIFRPGDLDGKYFIGLMASHRYEQVDNATVPGYGVRINLAAMHYHNWTDNQSYTRLAGSLSTYATVGSSVELTFANRIGAATLSNDNFLFYHSNRLGGNRFLRGFRNDRFQGQSLVFLNSDVRVKLGYFRNWVMPFELGISTGFDTGRVWTENEPEGDRWHWGVSPGVWFTPYKQAVVTAFYTVTSSDEQDTYTVRLGFFF